mmetsp:Transcript_18125/g.28509  ORF Transcript_18125/g.28509 Transcript_18125/m.28509 type:complete len:502 (+) Transcript_18125:69-1574(+)
MPVTAPKTFRTRIREITAVQSISDAFKMCQLGALQQSALDWCKGNNIDVEWPSRQMTPAHIAKISSELKLKPLEIRRLETVFLSDRRNVLDKPLILEEMQPLARPLESINPGNFTVKVRLITGKVCSIDELSDAQKAGGKVVSLQVQLQDTVAIVKDRIRVSDASLKQKLMDVAFAQEVLEDNVMLQDRKMDAGAELVVLCRDDVSRVVPDLQAALLKSDLARFQFGAGTWCLKVGAVQLWEVMGQLEHFCSYLSLTPRERYALRRTLQVPPQDINSMTLCDMAAEMACDDRQFRSLALTIEKNAFRIPKDIFKFLQQYNALLCADQCKALFDKTINKLSPDPSSKLSLRSQLVMGLHCFCVEPYTLWEDDGDSSCLWTAMTYGPYGEGDDTYHRIWSSGLCQDLDGTTAGEEKRWGALTREGACRGGCGFFANQSGYCSLCIVGKGPNYLGGKIPDTVQEARKTARQDVNSVKDCILAMRGGQKQMLLKPKCMGIPCDQL